MLVLRAHVHYTGIWFYVGTCWQPDPTENVPILHLNSYRHIPHIKYISISRNVPGPTSSVTQCVIQCVIAVGQSGHGQDQQLTIVCND